MIRAADISTEMPAFVPSGDKYATRDRIVLKVSEVPGEYHFIVIPKGYEFDGASIPRCLWSLIGSPFEPDLMLAACIHDWFCEHTSHSYESRVKGDSVFYGMLRRAKVAKWRRRLMYAGVRLNSFWFYGRRSS